MGQIVKFPIIIIDTKASEANAGLLDTLVSTIAPLSSASTSLTVSEQSVREALADVDFPPVSGENLGTSDVVFVSTDSPNIAYFRSISGMGVFSTNSDGNMVYINTNQSGSPTASGGTIIVTTRTLNGGIEQEASRAIYSNFTSASSMEAFHNVVAGDAIGKIMVKAVSGFNSGATQFSIGTDSAPEGFVLKFSAPTSPGALVPITYGSYLTDKVEYINTSDHGIATSNLVAGDDIKIYQYSPKPTEGELQVVIFYDKMNYGPFGFTSVNVNSAINKSSATAIPITVANTSKVQVEYLSGGYTSSSVYSTMYSVSGNSTTYYGDANSNIEFNSDPDTIGLFVNNASAVGVIALRYKITSL